MRPSARADCGRSGVRRAALRLGFLVLLGASALASSDVRVVAALLAGTVLWGWRVDAPAQVLVEQLRAIAPIALIIAAAHWALGDPGLATLAMIRIVTLVLAAGIVTAVTPTTDLLSVIEHALSPLRRLGVDPTRAGLTLLMTIRLIPLLADTLHQIRDAQRSRGVERPITSTLAPLVIAALRAADQLADALDARGLTDREDKRFADPA